MNRIRAFHILASFFLVILDFLWVSLFMKNKYNTMVSDIQNGEPMQVNYLYVILTYALLLIALNSIVIPVLQMMKYPLYGSFWFPFLFGTVVYSVYNMTNASIFKDWDIPVGFLDSIWGGVLFMSSVWLADKICSYKFSF